MTTRRHQEYTQPGTGFKCDVWDDGECQLLVKPVEPVRRPEYENATIKVAPSSFYGGSCFAYEIQGGEGGIRSTRGEGRTLEDALSVIANNFAHVLPDEVPAETLCVTMNEWMENRA